MTTRSNTIRPATGEKPRVLHLVTHFLPVTENWVYSQLMANEAYVAGVHCQRRMNPEQFPFDPVFSTHTTYGPAAKLDYLMCRLTGRYRQSPLEKTIRGFRPDLIHGHFSYESWRHIRAIRRSGLPLVTTFYGLDINKLPRRPVWSRRYEILFDLGAAFIVEGPFMGRKLVELGCPAGKISVIKIGVDTGAIRAIPRENENGVVRVLFVGLAREKKGAVDAATAFARAAPAIPGLRLELAGDGPYRKKAQDILGRAGVLDRCTFHGYLSLDKYRSLLGRCALALVPSVTARDGDTEGGAPVTAIEAQAAGIPVIGTTHCDIPEIVRHDETGLLCPEHDIDALVRNLARLAQDPTLHIRMGERAAERAVQEHDIRKQAARIAAVYDAAIGASR